MRTIHYTPKIVRSTIEVHSLLHDIYVAALSDRRTHKACIVLHLRKRQREPAAVCSTRVARRLLPQISETEIGESAREECLL